MPITEGTEPLALPGGAAQVSKPPAAPREPLIDATPAKPKAPGFSGPGPGGKGKTAFKAGGAMAFKKPGKGKKAK